MLQSSLRLFNLVKLVKCWQILLELISKGLCLSLGKEKESRLLFTSSTKREIRHFHVVVAQRRQRKVQKSVKHIQSCCFANLNLLLFCRNSRRCSNSLEERSMGGFPSTLPLPLVTFLAFSSPRAIQLETTRNESGIVALSLF